MILTFIMNLFLLQQLNIGQNAPNFSSIDQNGKIINLENFKGKKVILYFYPKDDTPGCTSQACNLRDNFELLKNKDYVIIGVSVDDENSHKNFSKKYNLPFSILVDKNKEISKKYLVYNNVLKISNRITFLINENGKIDHIIKSPVVKNHSQEIIDLWK